jgi:hypothetical protein
LIEGGLCGKDAVQGQFVYDKSLDAAQQAVSDQMRSRLGVGSVGNSPKPLYTNRAKTQKESLRNYPPLPTSDEFSQNALPPTEEPREGAFPGAAAVDVVPTPPIAYEEFDL